MAKMIDTGDRVVGPGKYMRAVVALEQSKVLLRVHVFNHVKLSGFHGGATASFSDSNGKLLYVTAPFTTSVEGQFLPFVGESDKWVEREFEVPAGVYDKTDRIDAWVAWTPRPGFFMQLVQDFISGLTSNVKSVEDLIKLLEEKFGKPAKQEVGLAASEPPPIRAARTTGLTMHA